ncbi:MAG: transglycosylase SLT domain-containing protein [Pyrinomonadaceae bacterium]|nr:transglycosylase SLT domain-containing protein [Pyrinomonadaceae bacterium]
MIIPHVHHNTKLLNLAFGVGVTLLATFSALGQTPQERHTRIRSAMDAGDVKAALADINSLRDSDSEILKLNNYDYLLGRLQEKTGGFAEANASYQSVVARQSVLSQYALWHLARLTRATGDLAFEREKLRQLIATAPKSLLREAAIMRLGQSFYESKDYSAAVTALQPLGESKSRSSAREAMILTGQSLLAAGKPQEAREAFSRLVMQMPDSSRPDDLTLAAVRGLDALEPKGAAQGGVAQPEEAEHLLRASVYQFNRDFDAARRHYLAVVASYPQSPTVANALYQTARGFYLQLKYDEALKYFQRVLEEFPDSLSGRDALSFTASTYNRLKRTDEAVVTYRRFIERFPDAPNPERAYLNIIDALHEAGRHKEALDWVRQTRASFKGQIGEALALFAQARIHLAQGAWEEVLADTKELRSRPDLGGTRVSGGTTQQELTLLRGYALEQLGRTNEAISEYLSIPDGRNEYYGKRSTQRLLAIGADSRTRSLIETRANALRADAEKAINSGQADQGRRLAQDGLRVMEDGALRAKMLELLLRAYEALPTFKLPSFNLLTLGRKEVNTFRPQPGGAGPSHQALAAELFFLGLYDEGVPEFGVARSDAGDANRNKPVPRAATLPETTVTAISQSDLDYTLAIYSLRGGLTNRAVRFGEQLWKNIPADYALELAPRELVDLLYPLPYRESLLMHAPPRGVDPRFVIAIARQESRYQPDAKSVAAARGLMQFIPETANDIAGHLGLSDFTQDHLYNPDTAILLGSQYLANLFKRFPAQSQAVAASYNGGPENVARWIRRSHSKEADRYVPELGFSQTKDYVFKVMTNFWIYQQIYDEKLERK